MAQANFAYGAPASDGAGLPLAVSVFADRAHLRDQMCEDIALAGFRLAGAGDLSALVEEGGDVRPLGDVVLIDCPTVDAARLAGLARLDLRAAHGGAQVVVATRLAALDDVFGCLDRCGAQVLIDPGRADWVVALGQVLARMPAARVREMSDEERLLLLRLTEQISQIAERIERLSAAGRPMPVDTEGSAFSFGAPRPAFVFQTADPRERLVQHDQPQLPDPKLLRTIIRRRQARTKFFGEDLFADPAWDMLLDLAAARGERAQVSVTSLCIASGVPPTTALRWIGHLTEAGLLERVEDRSDRRRAFIGLTDKAISALAGYFAQVGYEAMQLA